MHGGMQRGTDAWIVEEMDTGMYVCMDTLYFGISDICHTCGGTDVYACAVQVYDIFILVTALDAKFGICATNAEGCCISIENGRRHVEL